MRWTEYFAFFREEDCMNLLLFLELTELCKRVWQCQKNQMAGIRIILKKTKSCRYLFSFFLLKWSFARSAFSCCSCYCPCGCLFTHMASELWRLVPQSFQFLYVQVHNFLFSFNFPLKRNPAFNPNSWKITRAVTQKKKQRSELHATAACLIRSDDFWPFQKLHLSPTQWHSVTAKALRVIN